MCSAGLLVPGVLIALQYRYAFLLLRCWFRPRSFAPARRARFSKPSSGTNIENIGKEPGFDPAHLTYQVTG